MADNQSSTTLVDNQFAEGREYLFHRIPDGNPPGQIKAFVRKGRSEHRVALAHLPSEMQKRFIELTGKQPEELGLTDRSGGW